MAEGSNFPVDPKLVRRISNSPDLIVEQLNSPFMQQWEAPNRYVTLSKMSQIDRDVYFTIRDNQLETPQQIATFLDLPEPAVDRAIKNLEKNRLIQAKASDSELDSKL